jgi:hypothetical protein
MELRRATGLHGMIIGVPVFRSSRKQGRGRRALTPGRISILVIETNPAAETFYARALETMNNCGVRFLVGGAYAMKTYADIVRETKDLDVFAKAGDYPRLLQSLADAGHEIEITDATWLAKARAGEYYVDIIFASANAVSTVDDTWLEHAYPAEVVGLPVNLVSVEDQIWQKCFVQDRFRYDGADVAHIFRKWGPKIDWTRLLHRMEAHWELLFAHVLQFRYIYPAERSNVPVWLIDELQSRVKAQMAVPVPDEAVCRGPLLSKTQYLVDIQEWGYRER